MARETCCGAHRQTAVTQNTIALKFEFPCSTLSGSPMVPTVPARSTGSARDLSMSRGVSGQDRIARTALDAVCMPLLSTSWEPPSLVVSTRETVAVT